MSQGTPEQPRTARVAATVAVVWCVGCALIHLVCYTGWMFPFQCVELAAATATTLRIGPFFGDFLWQRGLDFLGTGAILATAFGLGAVIVRWLSPRRDLLTALFALGVGLWAVAVVVLIAAAVSVRAVPVAYLGLAGWFAPATRSFLRRDVREAQPWDGWSKLMLALLVLAAVLYLPGVLAPPFEYDELEYHLGALAEYQKAGRTVFLPHNFYSNLPQLTEMLYLLGLVTTSEVSAKVLHWGMGVLAAAAIATVATRLANRRVGLTAAVLFYCQPFVQDLSQTARIDLATTFFGTLAFGGLLLWWQEEVAVPPAPRSPGAASGWLWLSAVTAGGAVATKWPAVAVVVGPGVLFVLAVRRKPPLAALYGLLAAVAVLPWVVKNWVLTGNPVYPLWGRLFPNPYWVAEQAALFTAKHYGTFGWSGLTEFFTKAWHYSLAEPLAVPLLFMTAPLVWLVSRSESDTALARRAAWLLALAYGGWWLGTFRPYRFLFPALPLAAMVGAIGLLAAPNKWTVRGPVLVTLLVGLAISASVALVDTADYKRVPPRMNFFHLATGNVSTDEFARRMGGGMYDPLFWMNERLPKDAQVLYVGEARVFYARHTVRWSTAFDQHPLTAMLGTSPDPRELLARMRAAGITHVYVNRYEWQRLKRGYGYLATVDEKRLDDFLGECATLVYQHGPCTVYELEG